MTTSLMLIDVAIIVLAAKLAGHVAARVGQPAVVGEIAVGVLLAAVLRGGELGAIMLSPDVRGALHAIATIGLVLFMFAVGHEWNGSRLPGHRKAVAGVVVGSIVLPFALGMTLAAWLAATRYHPSDDLQFVLFIGTAMSMTALPVLARIVDERGLAGSVVGGIAIAAAAAVDVFGWLVLGVIAAIAGDGRPWQLALTVPYLVVLVFGVRPLLAHGLRRWSGRSWFGTILAGLFLSAAATEWLGLHAVFGAFLFGAVLPGHGRPVQQYVDEVSRLCHAFLLPVFFVVAALNVDLSGIEAEDLADLGLILLVAVVSKVGGAYLGARVGGMARAPAASVAALMNARGVTEIIVLQVGLQLGVLDTRLYSLMVLMALFTTAATSPLLTLIERVQRRAGPLAPQPLFRHGRDRPLVDL